jgi:hypothetical protein
MGRTDGGGAHTNEWTVENRGVFGWRQRTREVNEGGPVKDCERGFAAEQEAQREAGETRPPGNTGSGDMDGDRRQEQQRTDTIRRERPSNKKRETIKTNIQNLKVVDWLKVQQRQSSP